jgi:hypothetical protein
VARAPANPSPVSRSSVQTSFAASPKRPLTTRSHQPATLGNAD